MGTVIRCILPTSTVKNVTLKFMVEIKSNICICSAVY